MSIIDPTKNNSISPYVHQSIKSPQSGITSEMKEAASKRVNVDRDATMYKLLGDDSESAKELDTTKLETFQQWMENNAHRTQDEYIPSEVDIRNPVSRDVVQRTMDEYYKYLDPVGFEQGFQYYGEDSKFESLDKIFERALDLYNRIESSNDSKGAKKWKLAALDEIVKRVTTANLTKLTTQVTLVGYVPGSPDKSPSDKSQNPETDYAYQELQKSQTNNIGKQSLYFINLTEMQQLANFAEVANLLHTDEDTVDFFDIRSLESSMVDGTMDRMLHSRSEADDVKKDGVLKDLERENAGIAMNRDAFLAAYRSDSEEDGAIATQEVGTDIAYLALGMGLGGSGRRLTLDFIEFARANPGANYVEMEKYLNRNVGSQNLNNLSLSEFNSIGRNVVESMDRGSSQQIANIVNSFDNTVYNKRNDDELDTTFRKDGGLSSIIGSSYFY